MLLSPMLRNEMTYFLYGEKLTRVPFLNADDPSERRAFIKTISMAIGHALYANQELIISYGSRMSCMYRTDE